MRSFGYWRYWIGTKLSQAGCAQTTRGSFKAAEDLSHLLVHGVTAPGSAARTLPQGCSGGLRPEGLYLPPTLGVTGGRYSCDVQT